MTSQKKIERNNKTPNPFNERDINEETVQQKLEKKINRNNTDPFINIYKKIASDWKEDLKRSNRKDAQKRSLFCLVEEGK